MAKKVNDISLDEKLEQALVCEDEYPYSVPKNWCWTYVGNVCRFIGGGTPSKNKPYYWNGNIPWASVKDIKDDYLFDTIDYITQEGVDNSSTRVCKKDDLILVTRIEPGKATIAKKQIAVNQDLKIVKTDICTKYLLYYFKTFKDEYLKKSSGSTVLGITIPNIVNTKFPLPPLAEQKRIVEQIENLFSKLDEAKEKIEEVTIMVQNIKSSMVTKALKGELTCKWRNNQNVDFQSWTDVNLDKVCSPVKDKYYPDKSDIIYKYIGLEHICKGLGIKSYGNSDEVKSMKTIFQSNDVLYGRLRPYLDKHDVVEFDGICSTDILAFRVNSKNNNGFLNYIFGTSKFIDFAVSNSKGINLPRISEKEILSYNFKSPGIKEQNEIVRLLDEEYERCDKILENMDIIDDIKLLKKSILAKAFRGELSTTDLSEESSIELLKEILKTE